VRPLAEFSIKQDETPSRPLEHLGTIFKNLYCPCAQLGYHRKRRVKSMTAHRYREGKSTRIMVAKETLQSSLRHKLPLILINLDGITGYFDEAKIYYLRAGVIAYLIALSVNFRVVALCTG